MTEKERIELAEKQLSSEVVFDGNLLHVVRDKVELPNHEEGSRELIRHVGAVAIVPITENGEMILERQFRYPINDVITEVPAGKLDSLSEDRLEAAKRELREETGYIANNWTYMGEYYPTVAYSDERITLYLAEDLHKGERDLDDDEFLDVMLVPIEKAVDMVMKGEITDGKSQAAILKAYYILEQEE